MGFWSRWRQHCRAVREREFTDHPWGYPSQHELENGPRSTPGGMDLSQYYADHPDERGPGE